MRNDSGALWANDSAVGEAKVALAVVVLVGGAPGLLGNAVLASTIWRYKELQSKSSLLLLALALSDLGSALSCLLMGGNLALELVGVWGVSLWRSQLIDGVPRFFCGMTSSFLMFALALDRYLMVRIPFLYSAFSTRHYVGGLVGGALAFAACHIAGLLLCISHELAAFGISDVAFVTTPEFSFVILPIVHVPLTAAVLVFNLLSVSKLAQLSSSTLAVPWSLEVERRRRFQQSIIIVVRVYLVTWFAVIVLGVAVPAWDPQSVGQVTGPRLVGTVVQYAAFAGNFGSLSDNMSFRSNFFIYYARNVDYRKRFRRTLGLDSTGWAN